MFVRLFIQDMRKNEQYLGEFIAEKQNAHQGANAAAGRRQQVQALPCAKCRDNRVFRSLNKA